LTQQLIKKTNYLNALDLHNLIITNLKPGTALKDVYEKGV